MKLLYSTLNLFKLLILIGFFTPFLALAAEADVAKKSNDIVKMDRIIAVVDQSVITEQELADRIKTVSAQLEKSGTELPPQNILEKQIFQFLLHVQRSNAMRDSVHVQPINRGVFYATIMEIN